MSVTASKHPRFAIKRQVVMEEVFVVEAIDSTHAVRRLKRMLKDGTAPEPAHFITRVGHLRLEDK